MNKYNARKVEYKGMVFDSRKEFERYLVLLDLQKRGGISDLKRQVTFEVTNDSEYFKPIKYIADFSYMMHYPDKTVFTVEDVKGMRKGSAYSLFKLKKILMYDKYKIMVIEI